MTKNPSELKQNVVELYLVEHLSNSIVASLLRVDEHRIQTCIKNFLLYVSVERKKSRPRKETYEQKMDRFKTENENLKLLIEKFTQEGQIRKGLIIQQSIKSDLLN